MPGKYQLLDLQQVSSSHLPLGCARGIQTRQFGTLLKTNEFQSVKQLGTEWAKWTADGEYSPRETKLTGFGDAGAVNSHDQNCAFQVVIVAVA
jgi:hypothetical protein